jgi:hypothetical protein
MVHAVRLDLAEVVKYFVIGWVVVTVVNTYGNVWVAEIQAPRPTIIEGNVFGREPSFYRDRTKVFGFTDKEPTISAVADSAIDDVLVTVSDNLSGLLRLLLRIVFVVKCCILIGCGLYVWFWWFV